MGMEFVRQIDQKCLGLDELWLIARRENKMKALKGTTRAKLRYFPLDLVKDSYDPLIAALKEHRAEVKILVNSAGFGKTGPFMTMDGENAGGMVDVNCRALTKITHCIIPFMTGRSYIINLASAASFLPQPNFAVYAATKAYVLSFSRGLNRELRSRGIWVSAICPGPVDTEFFTIAEEGGTPYGLKKYFLADKEKVVAQALKKSFKKKEVIIYGAAMKTLPVMVKVFPQGLMLDIYAKMLRGVE